MCTTKIRQLFFRCFCILILTTIISTSVSTSTFSSENNNNKPDDSTTSHHLLHETPPPQQQQQPTPSSAHPPSSSPSSFFILCLTDGTIVSIDAWTGIHTSVLHTNPLVQRHYNSGSNNKNHDDSNSDDNRIMILPGLDGRLYYRPPPEEPVVMVVNDDGTSNFASEQISEAPSLPLQELPITMDQLLDNPVRSCQPVDLLNKNRNNDMKDDEEEEEEEECGILSAQTETSLLALSAQSGVVQWRSGHGSDSNHNEYDKAHTGNYKNKDSVLLLQRKDHFVQYVQINDGKQLWNVSLGNYQALDFDIPSANTVATSETDPTKSAGGAYNLQDKILMIDDDDDITNNNANNFHPSGRSSSSVLLLPAIALQNEGRTLVAIHPMMSEHGEDGKQKILWRQDVPSTLANVFGIANGKWQTIPIITSTSSTSSTESESKEETAIAKTLSAPPDVSHHTFSEIDDYERFLWNQRWSSSSLVTTSRQKSPPKYNPPNVATALPDTVDMVVLDDGASLCWVDEYEQWGTCPSNYNGIVRPLLTLPSGPPTNMIVAVHSEGVLLSWSIIVALLVVVVITILIIGRFWYMRKKEQWMLMYSTANSSGSGTNTSSSTTPNLGPSNHETSLTLQFVDETRKKSSSDSTSGAQVLQPSDRTNSNDNSNTLDGAIPLVRYSRYASEFQELRPLGKGGFGSVFQCENTLDGRQYAIKKVSIYSTNHDHFQQQLHRVLREVKILAVLDHPNIVRYYTAWLEIEEGHNNLANVNDATITGDGSTTNGILSPRKSYSSSILCKGHLNDEIIWDKTKTNAHDHKYRTTATNNNPLGWNNGLDLSDNSSLFLSRRQSLRDFNTAIDEYVIFEDSHEGDVQPKQSFILSGEHSKDDTSQYIKPHEMIMHHSDQSSTSADGEINDTTAFLKQESTADAMSRTLYIQMQLCSQKTLAEFLTDRRARSGSLSNTIVDIPKALRIFVQISDAAAHVHECGLIHRDLKPNNCFMDDACTTVKVGDFGLSRESKVDDNPSFREVSSVQDFNLHEDHTAGVGTRSYASPEQMNGSIYDSSSDVYSLGMMLFELLYPMYTGMERQICFSRLRDHCFPDDWATHVGIGFPSIKDLILNMLSRTPSSRPSAESVSRHIQSILGEFTLMSLDEQYHQRADISLLRVEAENHKDILQHVMQLIQDEANDSAQSVEIVQYGMRSAIASTDETVAAIMEFALRDKINTDCPDDFMSHIVTKLLQHPEIIKARVIHNASTNVL